MARNRNQHTTRAAAAPPVAALEDRACVDADPEIFFSHIATEAAEAVAICNRCPHQRPCLQWALETRQQWGIWGATMPEERIGTRRRPK
jgi:WhiB family redox-sensing transcriptional regulator